MLSVSGNRELITGLITETQHEAISDEEHEPLRLPSDRLSMLNHDVLFEIFSYVRADNTNSKLLNILCISKNLLPYTRRTLYHTVTFRELESLRLFTRAISPVVSREGTLMEPGTPMASFVKVFKFKYRYSGQKIDKGWAKFSPTELFRSLTCLEEIQIDFCPALAKFINSERASNILTGLRRLSLSGHIPEWADEGLLALSEECLLGLRSYRKLSVLRLFLGPEESLDWFTYQGSPPSVQSTFPVRELTLDLSDLAAFTNREIATFLAYFVHLDTLSLTLRLSSYFLNLNILFEGVQSYLQCLSLGLRGSEKAATECLVNFESAMSNFPSLRSLSLEFAACTQSTLLIASKCKTLRKLHLNCATHGLPYDALKAFLRRGTRPSNFEELTINHWKYENIKAGLSLTSFSTLPEEPIDVGWRLPVWPENFSFLDATALAVVCERLGLVLTGDITEAIKIQREWSDGIVALQKRVAAITARRLWKELGEEEDEL